MISTAIMCATCRKFSHHPRDIEEGYCGSCHKFSEDGVVVETRDKDIRAYVWGNPRVHASVNDGDVRADNIQTADISDWNNVLHAMWQEFNKEDECLTSTTPSSGTKPLYTRCKQALRTIWNAATNVARSIFA